jgi:hypothetical protein
MLRRGRLVVLSVAVGAATTFAALPGQAETLRSGLARAQLAKLVPYVGIPSVGAGAGVAQAEVAGGSAHASAGMADFGAMSLILGAVASKAPVPLPDLPGPITADDRDHPDVQRDPIAASAQPPATPPPTTPPAQPPTTSTSQAPAATPNQPASSPAPLLPALSGHTGSSTATPAAAGPAAAPTAPTATPADGAPPAAPAAPTAAWEEAHASKAPASRALVRGPELGVPGVLTFTGGESAAKADGGVTSSTVTIGRVVLGGASGAPEVVLSNLVWTARQAMGKPGTASFTIGSVTVAGQVLPVPAGVAPADVLKSVNDALTPLGLRLEVPVSAGDAAGATVSALVVQVRNPETVAGLLGQATQPAVPVLNQMLDTLLAAAPDAAASRLVVNALLATGTTRGGGRLELGGASARIGNVEVADLIPPAPPPVDTGDAGNFTPPFAAAAPAAPAPVSTDSAYGNGSGALSSGYESSLPSAAPIAPSGAAHTPSPAAAPGGSTVAARPVGTTAPGGASAPLVLGAALLAIAVLALGDKLRLRRIVGGG